MMEGNLGEAPSRHFPGISSRWVETYSRIVLWSLARQAVKWVPWKHQHSNLDNHNF